MASTQLPVSYDDVVAAQALIRDVVRRTPLESSRPLSHQVGGPVFLKCENLQRAGSFKIRGAYTRMARLSEAERAAGVVAASAGNHAQGVALAAQMLGIKAKVFMPLGAPIPKLMATRGYGAEIEQLGQTIDECLVAAKEYAALTGAVLIHPFDHPDIVAGQGTVGLEILEQCPDVQTIVVGMGGGGLTAGIATAVKAHHPDDPDRRRPGREGRGVPAVVGGGAPGCAGAHGDHGRRHRRRLPGRGALRHRRGARRPGGDGQRGDAVAGPASTCWSGPSWSSNRPAPRRWPRSWPSPSWSSRRSSQCCRVATSTRC